MLTVRLPRHCICRLPRPSNTCSFSRTCKALTAAPAGACSHCAGSTESKPAGCVPAGGNSLKGRLGFGQMQHSCLFQPISGLFHLIHFHVIAKSVDFVGLQHRAIKMRLHELGLKTTSHSLGVDESI